MRSMLQLFCVTFLIASLGGCAHEGSTASDTTAEAAVSPASFNPGNAPTVEFAVPDMMCTMSCAPKVEKTLAEQPGALDVRIDFESKTATVAVDEEKFDSDAAVAALVDKMFPNTALKTTELTKPRSETGAAIQ